jgi:hypothetical protein
LSGRPLEKDALEKGTSEAVLNKPFEQAIYKPLESIKKGIAKAS